MARMLAMMMHLAGYPWPITRQRGESLANVNLGLLYSIRVRMSPVRQVGRDSGCWLGCGFYLFGGALSVGASFENVMLIRETSMYVCSSSGSGSGSGTKVTYAVELPNSYVVGSGLKAQGRLLSGFFSPFPLPPRLRQFLLRLLQPFAIYHLPYNCSCLHLASRQPTIIAISHLPQRSHLGYH